MPNATDSCCRSARTPALFSLLGTQYGGNGFSNFALPDLRDAFRSTRAATVRPIIVSGRPAAPKAIPSLNNYKSCEQYICFFFSAAPCLFSRNNPSASETTTPDSRAALDITSTTGGVLFPKLTNGQQNTLAGLLTVGEKGMLIIDQSTGKLLMWTGAAWAAPAPAASLTAKAPLSVTSNTIRINPGTNAGDLLTWDGANWVNTQPATQHFSIKVDNHQPYLVANYVISLFGIYPHPKRCLTALSR